MDSSKHQGGRTRSNENYSENRERIRKMLNPNYGQAFLQDNRYETVTTDKGRTVLRNPPDIKAIEARKAELNLTNADILALFRSLSGGESPMTNATLLRKLHGESDLSAAEILMLSHILDLDGQQVLDIFNLVSKKTIEY